jgi:hypothetical protein
MSGLGAEAGCAIALTFDLPAPRHTQHFGKPRLPALDRFTTIPQLGAVVGIVPPVTPAAGDAADRDRRVNCFVANCRARSVEGVPNRQNREGV